MQIIYISMKVQSISVFKVLNFITSKVLNVELQVMRKYAWIITRCICKCSLFTSRVLAPLRLLTYATTNTNTYRSEFKNHYVHQAKRSERALLSCIANASNAKSYATDSRCVLHWKQTSPSMPAVVCRRAINYSLLLFSSVHSHFAVLNK
jgi:hypothetical protein